MVLLSQETGEIASMSNTAVNKLHLEFHILNNIKVFMDVLDLKEKKNLLVFTTEFRSIVNIAAELA